jgi:hypothetical protein
MDRIVPSEGIDVGSTPAGRIEISRMKASLALSIGRGRILSSSWSIHDEGIS